MKGEQYENVVEVRMVNNRVIDVVLVIADHVLRLI